MSIATYGLLAPRTTTREIAVWGLAACMMLSLHGGGLWAMHNWLAADEAAPSEAAPVMSIDLAPMLVAPDAVPLDMAELVDSEQQLAEEVPTEVTENEIAPLEKIEPEEIAEAEVAETQTIAEMQPEEEATSEEVAETVDPEETEVVETTKEVVETAEPEIAEALPTEEETVSETLIAEAETVPLPEVVEALPSRAPREKPEETRKPEPKKTAQKNPGPEKPEKKKPTRVERSAVAPSIASTKSAISAHKAAAPRTAQAGKSTGVSPARWQSRLNAHLNRHKRFPRNASGTALVSVNFAIDPSGRVLTVSVARSSGDAEFDQAALDMVNRASPVPAPPPEIASARMSLTVPVKFSRR